MIASLILTSLVMLSSMRNPRHGSIQPVPAKTPPGISPPNQRGD